MPVFRRLLSALLLAIPFLAARENAYAHVPAPVTLHRATITAGECLGDLSGWKTEHRQPIPEQTGHSLIAPFTGTLDLSGLTGKKNWRAARLRYEKAAENGGPFAQYFLGLMYLTGKGALKNPEKAFDWFLQAARRNVPEAQYWLADCYAHGRGTAKSDREAMRWYRIAAGNGHIEAQTVT